MDWYIFNEDDEPVAGPYATHEAAEFSLRVARTYDEVSEEAWIGCGLPDTFDDPANIIAEAWS